MKGEIEKGNILYCERKILPKNFAKGYETAYSHDRQRILKIYYEKVNLITENLSDVEAELRVNENYGPIIEISGISKNMEKALRKLLSFSIPPETQIGLPEAYGGPSTQAGFEIAKNIIEEEGHLIGAPGKGFEIVEGYAPIVKKKQSEPKT